MTYAEQMINEVRRYVGADVPERVAVLALDAAGAEYEAVHAAMRARWIVTRAAQIVRQRT